MEKFQRPADHQAKVLDKAFLSIKKAAMSRFFYVMIQIIFYQQAPHPTKYGPTL